MDKKTLADNVEKIKVAAGENAKAVVEQNEKNGAIAVRITLFEKKNFDSDVRQR